MEMHVRESKNARRDWELKEQHALAPKDTVRSNTEVNMEMLPPPEPHRR